MNQKSLYRIAPRACKILQLREKQSNMSFLPEKYCVREKCPDKDADDHCKPDDKRPHRSNRKGGHEQHPYRPNGKDGYDKRPYKPNDDHDQRPYRPNEKDDHDEKHRDPNKRPNRPNGKDDHDQRPYRPNEKDDHDRKHRDPNKRPRRPNEKDRDDPHGKYKDDRDGRHKCCINHHPEDRCKDRRDSKHGTDNRRTHKKSKKSYEDDYGDNNDYDSGGKKNKSHRKSKNQYDDEDTSQQRGQHSKAPQKNDREGLEDSFCGKYAKQGKHGLEDSNDYDSGSRKKTSHRNSNNQYENEYTPGQRGQHSKAPQKNDGEGLEDSFCGKYAKQGKHGFEDNNDYDSGSRKKKSHRKSNNQYDDEDTPGQRGQHSKAPQKDDGEGLEDSFCGKYAKQSKHGLEDGVCQKYTKDGHYGQHDSDTKKYGTYRKNANEDGYGSDRRNRNDKYGSNRREDINDKYTNKNKFNTHGKGLHDSCCGITNNDDNNRPNRYGDDKPNRYDDNRPDRYGDNKLNKYEGSTKDKYASHRREDMNDIYNNNNKYHNHGINDSCCGITNNDADMDGYGGSIIDKYGDKYGKQDRNANKYTSHKRDRNENETDRHGNKTRYDKGRDEYDGNGKYQRNRYSIDDNEKTNDTSGNRRHRPQNQIQRDRHESKDSGDNNQDRMNKRNSKEHCRRPTCDYPDCRAMDNNRSDLSVLDEFKLENDKCYQQEQRKKTNNEGRNDTNKDKQDDRCMVCIKIGKMKPPKKGERKKNMVLDDTENWR
ncbi:hypothetical protein WDU94_014938 [Cyamophila willieti]